MCWNADNFLAIVKPLDYQMFTYFFHPLDKDVVPRYENPFHSWTAFKSFRNRIWSFSLGEKIILKKEG